MADPWAALTSQTPAAPKGTPSFAPGGANPTPQQGGAINPFAAGIGSGTPAQQNGSAWGAPSTPGTTQTFAPGNQWQTPQSSLLNTSAIPQTQAQQFAAQQTTATPQTQALANGQGFTPQTLAGMNAMAMQAPANAGLQQEAQVKRQLGEQGITGPAAAAYTGNVAQQTGQNQIAAQQGVQQANAQQSAQNQQFGVNQLNQIGMQNSSMGNQVGMNNMNAANQLAMQNANLMFSGLSQNQAARINTQNQLGSWSG